MAARIAERRAPTLKPAIDAIRPPQAVFALVRSTRLKRPSEPLGGIRQILGVNHAVRSPLPDLLDGRAEVFEQAPIDYVDFTRFRQQCDKPRDAIDNPPRFAVTSLQSIVTRGDEKSCLLQRNDGAVRGGVQKEGLGLLWEVGLLR